MSQLEPQILFTVTLVLLEARARQRKFNFLKVTDKYHKIYIIRFQRK